MRKFINSHKSFWLVTTTILSTMVALMVALSAGSAISNIDHSPQDFPDITNIRATGDTASVVSKIYNELYTNNRSAEGRANGHRTVDYQGVSFKYNVSLASEIKAETKPAYALQYETDTGEGVVPEHITFKLIGTYVSQHEASFFSPEIDIYPIAAYKTVLSKSGKYTQQFEDDIRTLRAMLFEQPHSIEKKNTTFTLRNWRFASASGACQIHQFPKRQRVNVPDPIQYRTRSN